MKNKFTAIGLPLIMLFLLTIAVGIYISKQKQTALPSIPAKNILPTLTEEKSQQDLTVQARADLAERLDIPAERITTREVESVTWLDSSLGCPEPGKLYSQVLSPGYRIVLKADSQIYNYHTSKTNIKLCKNPATPPESLR